MMEREAAAFSSEVGRAIKTTSRLLGSVVEDLANGRYPFPLNLLRRGARPSTKITHVAGQINEFIANANRVIKGK